MNAMQRTACYTDLTFWKKSTWSQQDYDSDESLLYISEESEVDSIDSSDNPDTESDNNSGDDHSESIIEIKDTPDKKSNSKSRSRKRKRRNGFILDEADDAYDDEESFLEDEEGTQETDQNLSDFIVEDNYYTQTDCQPNYMQSVSHLLGGRNKFKLKYDYDPEINVYSQAVASDEDENEYVSDSFCCDEIVYDSQPDSSDLNVSSSPELKLRSRKVVRKSNQIDDESSPPRQTRKKRFKRIIIESP